MNFKQIHNFLQWITSGLAATSISLFFAISFLVLKGEISASSPWLTYTLVALLASSILLLTATSIEKYISNLKENQELEGNAVGEFDSSEKIGTIIIAAGILSFIIPFSFLTSLILSMTTEIKPVYIFVFVLLLILSPAIIFSYITKTSKESIAQKEESK